MPREQTASGYGCDLGGDELLGLKTLSRLCSDTKE